MQMTRLAPQPACARVRKLVAVCLGCVFWLSVGASARAQVRVELERALTVTRELPGCVSASALRARTAQYLERVEQLSELTIEVDVQVPQFRVLREGTLLAERRFARAPSDCTERRDALALAVAIAIEQVAENPAAESGNSAQPSAANDDSEQRAKLADERVDGARDGRTMATGAQQDDVGTAGRARADDPRSSVRATARPSSPRDDDQRAGRANAGERAGRATDDENAPVPPPSAADRGLEGPRTLTRSGRPRALLSLVGGGAVLFEALPTAAAGFAAGAELALLPALRIGLSGLFSLPVSSSFQGGTVSAQLFGAQLTGCVNAVIFADVLLHGCAGAVGGVIEARGDDFALNLSDRMGWIAGLVRARLEFPAAGRVAAGVYADARVNVLRPELQASLASEPARTRAVALFGAAVGVEMIVRLH